MSDACTTHHHQVQRAEAYEELSPKGWPNGFFYVREESACACGQQRTLRLARARSVPAAMAKYRKRVKHG